MLRALGAVIERHPRLAAWVVMALGMVIMAAWQASGRGLEPGQMAALLGASVGLAGVCAWIIGWE